MGLETPSMVWRLCPMQWGLGQSSGARRSPKSSQIFLIILELSLYVNFYSWQWLLQDSWMTKRETVATISVNFCLSISPMEDAVTGHLGKIVEAGTSAAAAKCPATPLDATVSTIETLVTYRTSRGTLELLVHRAGQTNNSLIHFQTSPEIFKQAGGINRQAEEIQLNQKHFVLLSFSLRHQHSIFCFESAVATC